MKQRKGMDRRDFIKASAAGLAGVGTALAAGPATAGAAPTATPAAAKIKTYRELGRTGFKASDIGIGTSQTFPTEVLKAAVDAGVNYFDTGEGYGRGAAERSIGEAIKGRDRKSLFITTKFRLDGLADTAAVAAKLEESLGRLQTDYVDCLMMNPPNAAAVKNEVYHQAIAELKKQGKVRFAGAGTHGARGPGQGEPMDQVLLAAVEDGRFDVILLVYNFLQREPGEKVLEAASKKNLGLTIMKSNPLGRYYDDEPDRAAEEGRPGGRRKTPEVARADGRDGQAGRGLHPEERPEDAGRGQSGGPQVRPFGPEGPHAQSGLQYLRRRPDPSRPLGSAARRPRPGLAGLL